MEIQTVVCGLIVVLFAGVMCAPGKRDLLDFTCGEDINCTETIKPLCGTDGKTYDNMCELMKENQYRVCQLGDFNKVFVKNQGNCTDV